MITFLHPSNGSGYYSPLNILLSNNEEQYIPNINYCLTLYELGILIFNVYYYVYKKIDLFQQ